ncbi:MAG: 5'-methylthioadenosine/S-adenosylhomocysteine nucleosidase [Sphingobium phenoxybenzoativorans]
MRIAVIALWLLLAAIAPPAFAGERDGTKRTAIMIAFPPERAALEGAIADRRDETVNGKIIVTGTLAGKPVILMESGVSMVNAAMNAQLLIDRFAVSRILFSGIAGGVDPSLHIGDVVIPDSWGQYLEVLMARETADGFAPVAALTDGGRPNYGMMHPRLVTTSSTATGPVTRASFSVDPTLLALASKVAGEIRLNRCAAAAVEQCLDRKPAIVVGGQGISGPAFVDNAAYRSYLFDTYHARVLDMESAAVAQVAFANGVPFLGFRSLSDLAGGDTEANQMHAFMALASANSAAVVTAFVAALPD